MATSDSEWKEVERRIKAFVDCVLTEAKSNPDFGDRVKKIVLSDSILADLGTQSTTKPKPELLDPLKIANENPDPDYLRGKLETYPKDQIVKIVRSHKILTSKEIRSSERVELIEAVVQYTIHKLKQGEVFLRPTDDQSISSPETKLPEDIEES